MRRSKWTLPAVSVVIGLIYLGAEIAGGNPQLGAEMFGIMAVFGLGVLVAGRSETVRGLRGDGRDERFEMLDLRATAFSGVAVILAILVAFVVEIARGHSGMPYIWLGTIAGLSYLGAVIYLRVRG